MFPERPSLYITNTKEIKTNIVPGSGCNTIRIAGKIKIDMTLTSPNCPVAESLPNEVKNSVKEIEEVKDVDLNLVWEPPWDKSMMTESAKLELNL